MRYPVEVFISFTTKCNLRCKHCYSNSSMKGNTINISQLLRILKKIKPLRLVISGGEPLIEFNKLVNFLEHYKKNSEVNSYIVLATNAVYFSEGKLKKLKPLVDRLQISLDSLNPKTFEFIRGVNLLEQTIKNILLAKNWGFDIQIAFTLFKENLEEIEDIVYFCQKNKIDKINILRQRISGRSKLEMHKKEILLAYQKFIEQGKNTNIQIKIHDPITESLGINSECLAAKEMVAIDVRGNLKPCPFFENSVEGDFDLVWENDPFFIQVRKFKDCRVSWSNFKKM